MSPKPDVSEARKNQILDAALDTFSQKGFHKTRMTDIADNSGLSKGAVYWYFDSKDSLILSLVDRIFEREIREFERLVDDPRSAEERIYAYANRAGKDIVRMLRWIPLFFDFIAMAFRRDLIKQSLTSIYQKNLQILEQIIQQGIDGGEFKPIPPRSAAIAIGAMIEGTIVVWLYDPDEIQIIDGIQAGLQLLLEGMKGTT